MPRRHLPEISFENRVSSAMARQDKIEILISLGRLIGNDSDDDIWSVRAFLDHLGVPPRGCSNAHDYGQIFNRPQETRGEFEDQPIRTRSIRTARNRCSGENDEFLPPPLFGGKLIIHRPHRLESYWTFELLLSLNPTRFIRHQRLPRTAQLQANQSQSFQYTFSRREVSREQMDEFPLITGDNWISDDRIRQFFSGPRFWQDHLRTYIFGSIQRVLSDIDRAANRAEIDLEPIQRNQFNLRLVETYWEFYSDNPSGTVNSFRQLLDSFSTAPPQATTRSISLEENSTVFLVPLPRAAQLRIYAKTNRRIRFEVIQRFSRLRLAGGHTRPTIEGILSMLDHSASLAADHINDVLTHFQRHASIPTEQRTVLGFLMDFQLACGDPTRAFELLQILVANRSLVVGRGLALGHLFERELQNLESAHVLSESNGRYSVIPPYVQAFMDLHESEAGFLLGPRHRRRG